MATNTLTNCTVLVNGTNLSGACNECTVGYTAEMLDATTFGTGTRMRKGGLTTITVDVKGFLNLGATGPDGRIFPVVGSAGSVFTFFPTTIVEGGYGGYAAKCVAASFNPGGPVGALLPFTATIEGAGTEV